MKKLFFLFLIAAQAAFAAPKVQISPLWQEDGQKSVQLLLPASKDLRLASFKNNGYTYFLFQENGKAPRIDADDLNNLPLIRIAHPSALILRGVFEEGLVPQFSIQGHILRLKMERNDSEQDNFFQKKRVPNGLLLEVKDALPIEFKDPNTFENLLVFLTPNSPLFTKEKYDTPEMTFLPTYQGFTVYSKTGKINLQKDQDGFVLMLQNPKSLTVTKENTDILKEIDWHIYADFSQSTLKEELENLKQFTSYVSQGTKERLQLEMAKILLTQGLSEDALAILENHPPKECVQILTFIALVLQNKNDLALKQWETITVKPKSLLLWKNGIDTEPLFRIEDFENTNFPPRIAFTFWHNIAQKALKQDNFILLAMSVDKIEKLPLNPYQKQNLLYLKGQIAELENDFEQAIQTYEKANNPQIQEDGKILFSKIKAELKEQKISNEEASKKLEKIRPLLAFTDQEVPLLQLLSELYEQQNLPVLALRVDKHLLSITQDKSILDKMQKLFEDYYFFHHNDKPFQHVLLYYEFKELMPVGPKAIRIKQHLIEDFTRLDLIKEAQELSAELKQMQK